MENELNNYLWAIYYESEAYSVSGERIMGRQAAGNSLLKAFARSDLDSVAVYTKNENQFHNFKDTFSNLLPPKKSKKLSHIPWSSPQLSGKFGGIYYPAPDISKLASQRFFYGHNNYSIIGVTHTTASENVINSLVECYTSPLMEWDSIICTSKSVKNSFVSLYDQYHDILSSKLGASKKPNFSLPVIPLGVHFDDYEQSTSSKSEYRKSLGIKENDIVLLFLGRLSFHAKAHYLPMYIALEEVAKKLPNNVNLHLLQTGWFPNDFVKNLYEDDAKNISPSVICHFLDGRVESEKKKSYLVSDIFISLVDNFQETFGLTPLEGMASGLPAVVSDWNGYKDTVRDNVDGFRIRTTTMEPGYGYVNALRHNLTIDTYDHYIGRTSQTVSVDIKEAIEKIFILASNKELRIKMGIQARERAKEFDWLKILELYKHLKVELDEKRELSKKDSKTTFLPPINIQDQYTFFNDYPTDHIGLNSMVKVLDNINNINIREFSNLKSVNFVSNIVPDLDDINLVYDYIVKNNSCSILELLNTLNVTKEMVFRIVLWLAKYGYLQIENFNNEK